MRPMHLTFALLAGCGDKAEDPYAHAAGGYAISFDSSSDDCDFETVSVRLDPIATAVEADSAAGTMGVDFDDGDQVLDCTLDINDFDCPAVDLYDTDLSSQGKDAVVTVSFGLMGAWTSDTAFSGTYTYGFSCSGPDCGDLGGTAYGADAALPCAITGAFSAALD